MTRTEKCEPCAFRAHSTSINASPRDSIKKKSFKFLRYVIGIGADAGDKGIKGFGVQRAKLENVAKLVGRACAHTQPKLRVACTSTLFPFCKYPKHAWQKWAKCHSHERAGYPLLFGPGSTFAVMQSKRVNTKRGLRDLCATRPIEADGHEYTSTLNRGRGSRSSHQYIVHAFCYLLSTNIDCIARLRSLGDSIVTKRQGGETCSERNQDHKLPEWEEGMVAALHGTMYFVIVCSNTFRRFDARKT
ncbi:hypothetical protein AG1IA_00955 [Rhizoctonia solani AG-1 IA]|uniref:Uncharacterized protein n=1 Tax=Thanatephorus cucumeris (strain AG1-IA) TaxID=983506 RepID=L8X459_THACA|nr:hypothetical protein AG1IA_00955 [Rhizoctonia solani AG-1 IA]